MDVYVDQNLIPNDEEERLAAVRRYDILDTPPDGAFDRITALAARHFSVPISVVSIVDSDRIWFKSHHGVGVEEIGRDPGLCASAILQHDPWIVEDAAIDPRTLANPLVAGEFGLRFYAGIPLETRDGYNLGTLCLLDLEPRQLTDEETQTLADMAAIVMDELELRLSARTVVEREQELRDQAERTARALQRSLLPEALPQIPGAEIAAFYQPADAGEVGGDFYDVFELASGGWAIVVGDVSGKGPAAAAVTAKARHTIRTATLSIDEPADVLALLNSAMVLGRTAPDDIEHYCTVHLSILRPAHSGFTLRTASAGHPPALLARAAGTEATSASGPPVGWHDEAQFEVTETVLRAGDVFLAYTDGLTEARRQDCFVNAAGLSWLLGEGHGEDAAALAERLRELLSRDDVEVRDDAAAVVLRVVDC